MAVNVLRNTKVVTGVEKLKKITKIRRNNFEWYKLKSPIPMAARSKV